MVSFVLILSLSVLPSFASAEVIKKTDAYTKWYIKSYSAEITFKGKDEGYSYLYGKEVITDLGAEYSVKYVKYYAQGGIDGGYIAFYDKDFRFISDNKLKVYGADSQFDVGKKARYVSVGHSTSQSPNALKVYDLSVFIDDGKVSDVTDLKAKADINKVELTWKNPVEDGFNGVNIYQDDVLIKTLDKSATSYTINDLKEGTMYRFKVSSLDGINVETKGVVSSISTLIDPKKVPPSNVTNLKVNDIKSNSVNLSWVNPSDNDLKGLRIFNGDKLVSETGIVDNFVVKDLKPNTSYEFKVVAVDNDGNLSGSSTVRFTTLEYTDTEPPESPKGLAVKQGSEALFLTWKNNTEKDLAGYNVYLDGKKINSVLVDNPFFTLRDLKNDADYKVQVSAVDKSGNESTLSSVVVGKPVSSGLPIIGTDYSLNDVTLGISEFFGSFWLIIAFAVSIPLSFYIAARVKLLFLD
ncbi:fibronectin [Bacillus thuringiensis]|nr:MULTISPECIES: fibronectin type III domain-containing protein [Bacillus cereus group]MBG9464987.1 fibronectin [Bacillus thuringiensis]MDA1786656.1 fibronectin type III domain-containing protein [Bacillus cereus]MDA2434940.1 fibronectin type III domain-containing protein [Bacillus cereus]MDA2446807.1 fibronectin type III domain-containing protein [Bacillus cereus]MDZ4540693.1 fibronectin type III domain-containing protein [Bacillus cereus]